MNGLNQHKKAQNKFRMAVRDEYIDKDFIIAKSLGYPEIAKTVENHIKRIIKLAKIDRHLTPHLLRHTHTSLLIEVEVGMKEIQQRLGHTDIETTMNIYAQITADTEEKASQKFSELMRSL